MGHGTSQVLFGLNPMWLSTGVLLITYAVIISEKINRSIIALLGAGIMVVSGVLTQEEAIRGIDFNTIALLTGMMVLVAIARRCGMFEYLAVWAAKKGRAQPWAILAMLSVVTAVVSAFLDNAPTYLVFYNLAGGNAPQLMTQLASTLGAISMGAVFMGALTYVGNAPNFMVYAIAKDRKVAMPSFFGYMLWSGAILIPLFVVLTVLFFR